MVDAGIEVKVEDYDGTYVCLFCGESVRGQPAVSRSSEAHPHFPLPWPVPFTPLLDFPILA